MSDFISYEDLQKLESLAIDLFDKGAFGECERVLRRLIRERPLRSDHFGRLGRIHESLGAPDAAQIAFRRERQLQIIESNSKPSAAVERLESLWGVRSVPQSGFALAGFRFGPLSRRARSRGVILDCVSLCGCALLQVCSEDGDSRRFTHETAVLKWLSDHSCETSPRMYGAGSDASADGVIGCDLGAPYRVTSYTRADQGGFGYGDLVLTLLEQRSLGYYVNDLAIDNIRYDCVDGLLRFADHSSAIELDQEIQQLPPRAFLSWCEDQERARVAGDKRYSFLLGSCQGQHWVWDRDRLLLGSTQLFHKQSLRALPEPSIQSVDTDLLHFGGTIDWAKKIEALDQHSFARGERILDIGCGSGLGARWLSSKACDVTGVEVEGRLVRAARVISTISQSGARFIEHDFDYEALEGDWDTVLLLAVFHCFINLAEAAERIAECCGDRIIIEAGLAERGYKWYGRWYRPRLAWKLDGEEELIRLLETYFQGFRMHGEAVDSIYGRKFYTMKRMEVGGV